MKKMRIPFTRSKPSKAMIAATSYDDWCSAAREVDQRSGGLRWRDNDSSSLIDGELMREHIAQFRRLIAEQKLSKLAQLLYESIYRHQGDIANPHLYNIAFSGAKQVIDDYLDAVDDALNVIADGDSSILSNQTKLNLMRNAQRNLGESALLLSGGASMGFFHLGVAKALQSQNLLPRTLCGASMGALIGGGICSRNDEELDELFTDLESIYRVGIKALKPMQMIQQRLLLDQTQLEKNANVNIGQYTFAEAAARTGRQFCVSVSPSRSRQKPRVLSAQTSPNILLTSAVIASCAIPGVYPPVSLKARDKNGKTVPYLAGERWVDGTFQGDLPMKRLGRLFNINHFIVSQVNPHAVPFLVSRHGRGPLALAADLTLSTARIQIAQSLKVLQGRVINPTLHNFMEHGRLLAEQEYKGDINIHPQINGWMYRRFLSNPSVDDLKHYIVLGERETWPKIAMIRNQTRTQATLAACVKRLEQQAN